MHEEELKMPLKLILLQQLKLKLEQPEVKMMEIVIKLKFKKVPRLLQQEQK